MLPRIGALDLGDAILIRSIASLGTEDCVLDSLAGGIH